MIRYQMNQNYRDELRDYWNKNLKKGRIWGFIVGAVLTVLGVLCLIFPVESVQVMAIIAGILMIAAGVAEIAAVSRVPVYVFSGAGVVYGVLNILSGIILLLMDRTGQVYLFGFIFAINMMVFGIDELVGASRASFFNFSGSGWLIASGVINIIMSIVFFFLPGASAITVSILAGIYLIISGVTLLSYAASARELKAD